MKRELIKKKLRSKKYNYKQKDVKKNKFKSI